MVAELSGLVMGVVIGILLVELVLFVRALWMIHNAIDNINDTLAQVGREVER